MRLVCPNCSAQYEIDGSMIPEEGRDVQCSNCGHTWFELPSPAAVAAETLSEPSTFQDDDEEDIFDAPPAYDLDDDDSFEEEEDTPTRTAPQTTPPDFLSREEFENDDDDSSRGFSSWNTNPETGDAAPDASEPDAVSADTAESDVPSHDQAEETEDDDDFWNSETRQVGADDSADTPEPDETFDDYQDDIEDDDPEEETTLAAGLTAGGRRPADAAALDILREEAERELSKRRTTSAAPMETQADLGLEDIRRRQTPSRALRARMAHLGEELPEEEPEPILSERTSDSRQDEDDGYEAPRRDLLPDIDEINSTLKRDNPAMRDREAVRRSGFRVGFIVMLFFTIAAIFAYAQAPAIARALPQAEPSIISYVDWANGLRDWISGLTSN